MMVLDTQVKNLISLDYETVCLHIYIPVHTTCSLNHDFSENSDTKNFAVE